MNENYPFINVPLPYDYSALEPYIDNKTMMLHHDKHLQTYIDNLNNVLKDHPNLQGLSLEQLLMVAKNLTSDLETQIVNNAGGVYNHFMYFDELSPDGPREPVGKLADAIKKRFGDFENFKSAFKKMGLSVFGSGYAWLICDGEKVNIAKTPNQDNPIQHGLFPIINLDVWEHAYYLKNYNVRSDYIDNWFSVLDWNKANDSYIKCVADEINL